MNEKVLEFVDWSKRLLDAVRLQAKLGVEKKND